MSQPSTTSHTGFVPAAVRASSATGAQPATLYLRADNPKWGSCFCQFLYVDHAKVEWQARTAAEIRAAACARIGANRMQGLLAYRDGKPVAWCNAAPRTMMDAFAEPDPDAERIGQITCFVVAKAHRRSGSSCAAACCKNERELQEG